jgi:hypothetical protein
MGNAARPKMYGRINLKKKGLKINQAPGKAYNPVAICDGEKH